MAKKKQASEVPQSTSAEPTEGYLEASAEPETTPQSIAAGVLEDMEKHPPKRKPGRPKKEEEDLDVLPPRELLQEDEDEEPEDEPTTEATEGDDEAEEPELKDALRTLAEENGVPLSYLEDCQSVEEAERSIQRMYRAFYQHGQQVPYDTNGQEEDDPEPIPARTKRVQTKAEDEEDDLDLADYDEDDKTPKNLKRLKSLVDKQAAELKALKDADRRRQEIEFYRARESNAREFQDELFKFAPDLFGSEKSQTIAQQRRIEAAFQTGNIIAMGAAQWAARTGQRAPSVRVIAQRAVRELFADELAQQKIMAKRQAISERTKRRLGAPLKKGTRNGRVPDKIHDGPMEEDPFILEGVRDVLTRLHG